MKVVHIDLDREAEGAIDLYCRKYKDELVAQTKAMARHDELPHASAIHVHRAIYLLGDHRSKLWAEIAITISAIGVGLGIKGLAVPGLLLPGRFASDPQTLGFYIILAILSVGSLVWALHEKHKR